MLEYLLVYVLYKYYNNNNTLHKRIHNPEDMYIHLLLVSHLKFEQRQNNMDHLFYMILL